MLFASELASYHISKLDDHQSIVRQLKMSDNNW